LQICIIEDVDVNWMGKSHPGAQEGGLQVRGYLTPAIVTASGWVMSTFEQREHLADVNDPETMEEMGDFYPDT
jgi:hypothetical protein